MMTELWLLYHASIMLSPQNKDHILTKYDQTVPQISEKKSIWTTEGIHAGTSEGPFWSTFLDTQNLSVALCSCILITKDYQFSRKLTFFHCNFTGAFIFESLFSCLP